MSVSMDPALGMLNQALSGDRGALSFLDRTSSIYVLDVTNPSKPKTYGGWNFIHQAMTELERQESRAGDGDASLRSHVQLIAAMSQRAARRSPSSDTYLVSTCIENAAQYHATANEAERLINLNSELREIVMGRIAALVFDFSFHNPNGPHLSAFADPVAMESLCAVLATNAVSSGPQAIKHFLEEWIIPSVQTLPPFAVACVILHLAREASGSVAPAGTKDALQRLSSSVISLILVPVLRDAILERSESQSEETSHQLNSHVAAASIRAMHRWCVTTDLTLPQIKHVTGKVQINVTELISDAMYSDSNLVVEAMAELLSDGLDKKDKDATKERMAQARYIMEVDEVAFQSISPADLFRIESTEMDAIINELVAAVGLQRFRFVQRQANGDYGACLSLAQIAASVSHAALDALASGQLQGFASGLVALLLKAVEHPSIYICGIALEAVEKLVSIDTSFSLGLLPILQRRAIAPYTLTEDYPSLNASDVYGVSFNEFENFRETVMTDALVACFRQNPDQYMESCTAAMEEFCAASPSHDISFRIEAALFCLSAVAENMLASTLQDNSVAEGAVPPSDRILRCTQLLGTKPVCVLTSPFAVAQMCNFLGKYAHLYTASSNDVGMGIASELCLLSLALASSEFSTNQSVQATLFEMSSSPFAEASRALNFLLTQKPAYFAEEAKLDLLRESWQVSYNAVNTPNVLTIKDRETLCEGLCRVAASLSEESANRLFHAISLPCLDCLKKMTNVADEIVNARQTVPVEVRGSFPATLMRVAHEIRIVVALSRSVLPLASQDSSSSATSSKEKRSLALLHQAWPSISHIAEAFNSDEHISEALAILLVDCTRYLLPKCRDEALLAELCTLASSILTNSDGSNASNHPVCECVKEMIVVRGEAIEKSAMEMLDQPSQSPQSTGIHESGRRIEGLLLSLVDKAQSSLGAAWTSRGEQGNGQQPFESRNDPVQDETPPSTEGLSCILPILTTCAKKSPSFLMHLPAGQTNGSNGDRLLGRAITSCLPVLVDGDFETSLCAIVFLKSIVDIAHSSVNEKVREVVQEPLSRVWKETVLTLFAGVCGGLHQTALQSATELCFSLLNHTPKNEVHRLCVEALEQEVFLLGQNSKIVCLQILEGCSRDTVDVAMLEQFFSDIWALHQVDDKESIAVSDGVSRFIGKYSR